MLKKNIHKLRWFTMLKWVIHWWWLQNLQFGFEVVWGKDPVGTSLFCNLNRVVNQVSPQQARHASKCSKSMDEIWHNHFKMTMHNSVCYFGFDVFWLLMALNPSSITTGKAMHTRNFICFSVKAIGLVRHCPPAMSHHTGRWLAEQPRISKPVLEPKSPTMEIVF